MFTTSTETVTSQSQKTTFTCSSCSYSSRSREDVVMHYGEKHAVKSTRFVGDDLKLHLLETEDDFKAWVAHEGRDARVFDTKWRGRGWYSRTRSRVPCPKGCCTDICLDTEFAEDLVEARREELREKAAALRELMKLLKEAP